MICTNEMQQAHHNWQTKVFIYRDSPYETCNNPGGDCYWVGGVGGIVLSNIRAAFKCRAVPLYQVSLLGQWLNFKLFGTNPYLVGKIKFKLLFQGSTR